MENGRFRFPQRARNHHAETPDNQFLALRLHKQSGQSIVTLCGRDHLLGLYGDLSVAEFSPLKLSAVINEMIRFGWKRKSINNHLHRLRKIFRWGVTNELVPESVHRALSEGRPIGTGLIEGGCKTIVSNRLTLNSARWTPTHAEQIAALRCLDYSGLWPDFWSDRAA